jgi:hypothetical protein
MTTEPPVSEPTIFEERRAPERRRYERRAEDRIRMARTAAAAAFAVAGGLVVLYLFFALLGAVDFTEAAVASIGAIVLSLVWLGGYYFRHRAVQRDILSDASRRDRERRGY